MDCRRTREILWPPERPRLAADDVLKARGHVEGCVSCREYFAQDRLLLQTYDSVRRESAPRAVRERVLDALARGAATGAGPGVAEARPAIWKSPAHRRRAATALVVLAGLTLAGALARRHQPGAPDAGAVFVEDYLRRAVGEDRIVASDPEAIARFLARELGLVRAPLSGDGLELTGAEICFLEGHRGAMITYHKAGRILSYYVIPNERARARPPEVSPGALSGTAGGSAPTVVTWATASLEQALVGAFPPGELLALARHAALD